MCGIFGWLKHDEALSPEELVQARKATQSLRHRGPDSGGEWVRDRVFMGHRRLSILDLSDAANQPFVSADDRYIIAYNGEIYNYQELRTELEKEGHRFRTSSDTEVFLTAFAAWGPEAFARFDGMFAAGIHDTKTGAHYLVRDHLGQKPLFYHEYENGLIYGSELRALLGLEGFAWRMDRDRVMRFLLNAYFVWDETPLTNAHRLLAGCYLKIRDGKSELVRYWDSIPGRDQLDLSEAEALDQAEELIDDSCRIAMRSDVPYGVFLSGGVDSALVLDFCRAYNPDVATFSVGMGEADYDESSKAGEVSRFLGICNHEVYRLDEHGLLENLDRFYASLDEPHGDPGYVNALFLARSCRPNITVALAGDGGDELFAGYLPFKGLKHAPKLSWLPGFVPKSTRALAASLLPGKDAYLPLQVKLTAYLQGFPAQRDVRMALWLASLSPEELGRLCGASDKSLLARDGRQGSLFGFAADLFTGLQNMNGMSPQQRMHYFYQKTFLPEFVCCHTDRAAMQASLEVRSPLLSVRLIEFANRLPDSFKLRHGDMKWILKRIMEKRGYPESIVAQKKQGFTFPIARWLKTKLQDRVRALAESEALEGVVDRAELKRTIESHMSGKRNTYRILFNLMALDAWRRNYPQVGL